MTREVPARPRPAAWLLALLLSLGSLAAAEPAHAARTHAAHQKVLKKSPHAKPKARSRIHLAAKHSIGKKKLVARSLRIPAQPAVAAIDGSGPLQVTANVAYVVDQDTGQVLFGKNEGMVHPIASLTKLMTGMIIAEAQLPMDETIAITDDDVDRLKFSSSRLKVGTVLTRAQAMHLALMSSENRAAHALARTYPGGQSAFVSAMNVKAAQLGMEQTRYVEPTGLSSQNRSTAHDLALLTAAASGQPLLREYSTSPGYRLATGGGTLQYVNTNRLVRSGTWDIAVQKTGFINEAGECLLLQAKLAGRKLVMVFLDSASAVARFRDAERVRAWLHSHPDLTAKHRDADTPS
jgi:D-alanyl-D-alanine endopeptidase (penicillin-binding protein 7)